MSMIPPTKNGLPAMGCLSAMQKCIRRGMEKEAMQFACELLHTSKGYHTMVCNRLEIISHEDIDTAADPRIVPFVKAAVCQAKAWYTTDIMKIGKSRMAIGNAIRLMCRAVKSREGDHFQAAIGFAGLLNGFVPTIPDWANDGHTIKGKAMGRGVDYFRAESTRLEPPAEKDAYEDDAYRMWTLKAEHVKKSKLL
jgi:replication-associated recombination protein RarA